MTAPLFPGLTISKRYTTLKDATLVIDALAHAHGVRGSLDGAIFHSDHGSVYTSQAFRNYCSSLGVRQSMGAVGTSADRSPSRII